MSCKISSEVELRLGRSIAVFRGRRKFSSFVLFLCLFLVTPSAPAQPQNTYYVFDGKTLEITHEDPAHANYLRWQVWLFQEGVHIPHYTASLQYSRWGLIEGTSAASVMKRLRASESFEEGYLKFFGPGTWGQYTFFNPLGPVAVTNQVMEAEPAVLEKLYHLRWLDDRVNKLITTVQPSLENNESEGPGSALKEYFDQIRDTLERVSKIYSELARVRPQLQFIKLELARTQPAIVQAENKVPEITAVLPSVKLPTSLNWMFQAQNAGRDGTIEVQISETGSGVAVQQTWKGGDGSMTGTIIATTIPYKEIGNIDLVPPTSLGEWTVRVHAARAPFPQRIDSPERKTIKATYPAVHYETTGSSVYFVFPNSADAQDTFAYFLYHKQLGQ
jgi:hypothetical protein